VSSVEHWDAEAQRWVAWARAPGHDSYWSESGPPFFELLPPPGRWTLDVGCGEGRVARDLKARGHRVTGVDAAPAMLRHAREADPDGEYVLGDAAALPFDDGSFDCAVAFNSLMDVDDLPGAVRETARVLEPGGRFCICVTHPFRDAGAFHGGTFAIAEPYLETRRFELTVARSGLEISFRGWVHPLETYMRALEAAGFVIEAMREPPDPGRPLPNFLLIRARSGGRTH
jgi:ubiquinone/menaquinone biosynthesis C-methylase UbiE